MKLNFKTIIMLTLLVLVFGLIFMFQTIVDYFNGYNTQVVESQKAVTEISDLLLQIDKISFDTNILTSAYFQSLNTIPTFPLDQSPSSFGKPNPFSSTFTITAGKVATSTVGGIIPSNQRQDGQAAITSVNIRQPTTNTINRRTGRRR